LIDATSNFAPDGVATIGVLDGCALKRGPLNTPVSTGPISANSAAPASRSFLVELSRPPVR
jgi:hypothetical protein